MRFVQGMPVHDIQETIRGLKSGRNIHDLATGLAVGHMELTHLIKSALGEEKYRAILSMNKSRNGNRAKPGPKPGQDVYVESPDYVGWGEASLAARSQVDAMIKKGVGVADIAKATGVRRQAVYARRWRVENGVASATSATRKKPKPKPENGAAKGKYSKLTRAQVVRIKRLLKAGEHTQSQIARMYGVSTMTISDIANGKTWVYV